MRPEAGCCVSSLADLPDLVGFFSYSNSDDAHSDGALSVLRPGIRKELQLQLGRELRLWQDVDGALRLRARIARSHCRRTSSPS